MTVLEIIGSAFILAGALVAAVASVGLVRFPDVLSRMHAASKPQTFGLILLMIGAALVAGSWAIAGMLLIVVLAQLLTITSASAMLGRAAFRRGFVHGGQYVIDELSPRLATGRSADDDDDGFLDRDPKADGAVDTSEPLPSNTLTETTGLELADLKQFWDEHDGGREDLRTGEFSAVSGSDK